MLLYSNLFLVFGCSGLKERLFEDNEPEEEDEDSHRNEGDRQGDCLDGEDNDEDGYIDCEDQGCDGKPACEADTGIADTADTEDTDDTGSEIDETGIDTEETEDTQDTQDTGEINASFDVNTISPLYGSAAGGINISIEGGPFTTDTEVFFGTSPATVMLNNGNLLQALAPAVSMEGIVDIRVVSNGGEVVFPDQFTYYQDGTGLAGTLSSFTTLEIIGDYWSSGMAPEATFQARFIQPADVHWWELYAPTMDTCTQSSVDANGDGISDDVNGDGIADSNDFYSYSQNISMLDIGSDQVELNGDSTYSISRDSLNSSEIEYYSYTQSNIMGADLANNYSFSLNIPEGPMEGTEIPNFAQASSPLVSLNPSLDGTNIATVSPTQTFLWTSSGADWIQIELYHINSNNYIDSKINCVAIDDGSFTISNIHQNWTSGDIVYVNFSRVIETETILPHNNTSTRSVGIYTSLGAGIME